jgi:hypothetical protein
MSCNGHQRPLTYKKREIFREIIGSPTEKNSDIVRGNGEQTSALGRTYLNTSSYKVDMFNTI